MFGYGVIEKIISKIRDTPVPEHFTHDYLAYTLGFSRESDRAFIPLAKRIGLLSTEGKPTESYLRLRDPAHTCATIAAAMKHGYPMFYSKHPNVEELDRKVIAGLVADATGLEPGHASARAIVGCFFALKALAHPRVEVARSETRRKAPDRRRGA
jgi:hypothetical protein